MSDKERVLWHQSAVNGNVFSKIRLWWARRKQTTFCYCKNCMNELCSDPIGSCYDAGSEVHYVCGKCGWQTDFLFDAPVPIYLRCYSPEGEVFSFGLTDKHEKPEES
jgi:hypothetical protein